MNSFLSLIQCKGHVILYQVVNSTFQSTTLYVPETLLLFRLGDHYLYDVMEITELNNPPKNKETKPGLKEKYL